MAQSPKTKGHHEKGASSRSREDEDGGRGTPEAQTGSTIVPDVKGGTGERGDDDDDRKHRRSR